MRFFQVFFYKQMDYYCNVCDKTSKNESEGKNQQSHKNS